jgi:hypothetical protein
MTRRRFLETMGRSASALGATAVVAPAVISAGPPNDTIGVGCIGAGVRGGTLVEQVAGTDKRPGIDGASVVSVCDVYKAHREKGVTLSRNPDVRTCEDYRELLDDRGSSRQGCVYRKGLDANAG